MRKLPEAFFFLSLTGLWQPPEWKSISLKIIHRMWKYSIIIMMIFMMTSMTAASVIYTTDIDSFAENCFLLSAGFYTCVKCMNLLWKMNDIKELIRMFTVKQCLPRNIEEFEISSRFDRVMRYLISIVSVCSLIAVFLVALTPALFFNRGSYILPAKAWFPFKIQNDLVYYSIYVYQTLMILTLCSWNCGIDGIIFSLIWFACCQFEIISNRLKVLPDHVRIVALNDDDSKVFRRMYEKAVIRESVQHHIYILYLIDKIKSIFAPSIMIQYCVSALVICVTIYIMSAVHSNLTQLILLFMYLLSVLNELLLFNWFGNEITLKSLQLSDNICSGEWTELQPETLKELLLIMMKSSSPIAMTCSPLITLSNSSFFVILKFSYSAFNLLKQTN